MKAKKALCAIVAGSGVLLASCSSEEPQGPQQAGEPTQEASTEQEAAPQEGEQDNSAPDPNDRTVPEEFFGPLDRASNLCNEVDVNYIASVGSTLTSFDVSAQSGELSGPYLLDQRALDTFGEDGDGDGQVSAHSPADSTYTLARMACNNVGLINKVLYEDPEKIPGDNPYRALIASLIFGGDPLSITEEQLNDPLMQRWQDIYNQYQEEGLTKR